MLKPVDLEGFVLQEEDLRDFFPDATQEEMDSVAEVLTDGLMEEWAGCLEYAVQVIKNERNDYANSST